MPEIPSGFGQNRGILFFAEDSTANVIQFNTVFAIAVKLIFLVLAVFGYTSLWLAIAADTGAALLVSANALRPINERPIAFGLLPG